MGQGEKTEVVLLEENEMTTERPERCAEFSLPASDLAVAAMGLASEAAPPFVYNHSVRSYLYAREVSAAKGLKAGTDYDDELVFLSCILHDLGVTDRANGNQRFEVDGADAAASFLRAYGVDETRTQTVWNAIALHTSDGLAHRFGPVEGVAQIGIAADILGRDRDLMPEGFADRVHAVWPRHDLGYTLAEAIAVQVRDNPAKGSPLNFPGHLLQLHFPTGAPLTWFDLVNAAGWNDKPPTTLSDHAAAATAEQLGELFMLYFNSRDLDALLSLYEPAAFFAPQPGQSVSGTEGIRNALESMMAAGATIKLETRRLQSVGDLAVVSNTATVSGLSPDGSPLITTTTEVARRQPGGRWLYVLDDPFFSV
ncbi:nuclear transport factor 2 family protein [Streptomyces antimycoticus]|uniref:nuclear transport factor 2 family protein n=1 Tax=Streptomyces antimycoticus TaxID=68175 RepID=UPI0037D9193B